ncbi:MAG TPA: type II toxin-antitoxin system VapC family toxin [Thermoanaerobaculia bacterium]|nr:type II toxin-antitoxin system VapC family toxin [Thermoanaerobaculia bacterium]
MKPEILQASRTCVLDASALLAVLHDEPGGDLVESLLETAVVSSVNWSEVLQKALERQTDLRGLREDLESLGLEILAFTAAQAERAAQLRSTTRHLGLSLADRACLALAAELELPAITTDRVWQDLALDIEIRLARP